MRKLHSLSGRAIRVCQKGLEPVETAAVDFCNQQNIGKAATCRHDQHKIANKPVRRAARRWPRRPANACHPRLHSQSRFARRRNETDEQRIGWRPPRPNSGRFTTIPKEPKFSPAVDHWQTHSIFRASLTNCNCGSLAVNRMNQRSCVKIADQSPIISRRYSI